MFNKILAIINFFSSQYLNYSTQNKKKINNLIIISLLGSIFSFLLMFLFLIKSEISYQFSLISLIIFLMSLIILFLIKRERINFAINIMILSIIGFISYCTIKIDHIVFILYLAAISAVSLFFIKKYQIVSLLISISILVLIRFAILINDFLLSQTFSIEFLEGVITFVIALIILVSWFISYQSFINELLLLEKVKEEKEKAEEANRAKSDFLSNMSHELRTPLNPIIGLTDILSMEEKNKEKLEIYKIINDSGKKLLEIVISLLEFSKIENKNILLKNTNFKIIDLINYLDQMFTDIAKKSNLDFKIIIDDGIDCELLGDLNMIEYLFFNLIMNSIKYTEKGYTLLKISKISEKESILLLKFEVIDTGIGISKENQSIIFEKFVQGEPFLTKKHSGIGLGLAICKNYVDLMGGNIYVISEDGKGSNFTIELPLEKSKN
ncbi:MAG: hypothetical protein A2086_04885 [Spirochaetes bacterium GWD1_27_9]|nr:MAG: hypothetical protein A2Z98_04300 [Spirochaetes bacterium GWB1_27_13]OHD27641.1 MAG: hypothetical protein A2Y34_00340 [Spirochaetes bacterium GWC1_27_15]OHD31951.1 MAG: hypothetical protein A2086_04885 [Spirochaetes bacterium GWD1_27_9]